MILDDHGRGLGPRRQRTPQQVVIGRRLAPAGREVPGPQSRPLLDHLGHQRLLDPAGPEAENLTLGRLMTRRVAAQLPVPVFGPGEVERAARHVGAPTPASGRAGRAGPRARGRARRFTCRCAHFRCDSFWFTTATDLAKCSSGTSLARSREPGSATQRGPRRIGEMPVDDLRYVGAEGARPLPVEVHRVDEGRILGSRTAA